MIIKDHFHRKYLFVRDGIQGYSEFSYNIFSKKLTKISKTYFINYLKMRFELHEQIVSL